MGIFDNLPYTNFHDLNLDWIIAEIKKVREEWDTYRDQSNTWKAGVDSEIEAFRTWFDNLDVSDEVRAVVNDMVSSGEFLTVTTPAITSAVSAWLQQHIAQETGYVIDDTLSVAGAAADAKVAGDGIRYNKSFITFENCFYNDWTAGGWSFGVRNDSTARRRIDKEFSLQAGDMFSIKCDNAHTVAVGVFDETGVTILHDTGWVRDLQYTVDTNCIVCIQAANNNTQTVFNEDTFEGSAIISYSSRTDNDICISDNQILDSVVSDLYDETITIDKTLMEYGTYDSNGYVADPNKNRCRTINRHIEARYGDLVVGKYNTTNILCSVIDPDTGAILYTTGFRNNNFAIEISNNGLFVFLGGAGLDSFDGSFTIYRKKYHGQPFNYFDNEISETLQTIVNDQTEPCICFPVITDIHYGNKTNVNPFLLNKTLLNMEYIINKTRTDFIVGLGDMQDGAFEPANAIAYGRRVNNMLHSLGIPYYLVLGNHDDNRYGTQALTAAQLYAANTEFRNNKVVFLDSDPDTYYFDYENYKTRFIVLNSNNGAAYGFKTEVVNWFSNIALDTPADFTVILLTHISPVPEQNYNNTDIPNSAGIRNAIQTFINDGGKLLQIYGHSHCDVVFTSPYNSIGICCNKFTTENGDPTLWPSGGVMPDRTLGDASEDLWDYVIIKPFSRTANFIRFGAGSDKTINY